ncbi:hypothetical protein PMAYCL1PPCAC_03482, partial [Pristionchus mayeri]
MAVMGDDPCARLMPFLLTYGVNEACPRRRCGGQEGPMILIRYRDAAGKLQTLQNFYINVLSYDSAVGMWKINFVGEATSATVYAMALACAEITNVSACPCQPLATFPDPTGAYQCTGPVAKNVLPPCPPSSLHIKATMALTGKILNTFPTALKATCMANTWFACVGDLAFYE